MANENNGPNKQRDLDTLYALVFQSEAGAKVLADLRQSYLEQPTWFPGDDASHGFHREGQNSVVRQIEGRIKRART